MFTGEGEGRREKGRRGGGAGKWERAEEGKGEMGKEIRRKEWWEGKGAGERE